MLAEPDVQQLVVIALKQLHADGYQADSIHVSTNVYRMLGGADHVHGLRHSAGREPWGRADIRRPHGEGRELKVLLRHGAVVKAKRTPIPEVFEIDCIECGGDGDWGKFLFEGRNAEAYARDFGVQLPYVRGSYLCVDCKGTGRVYT